jgi:rRNA-processing protein FCF1
MTDEKQKKELEYDVFIANAVFPEAEAVFSAHVKSPADLKDDAIVVLDTNALLVPYGIGRESLDQIRQTYKSLVASQRLVIPGQVAREFAKNRASKISELFQQLNRKKNVPGLHKGTYPLLESVETYQQVIRLEKEIDERLRDYKQAIDQVLDHIREWTWNDPVSLMYVSLFSNGAVLDPPIDREEVRADLLKRQVHRIPPGYKDSGKEDAGIGDLLIWYTILEIGKSRKQSVIFVSGEQKADWWHRSEGQALYPRYELVDEFRRCSDGQFFHIVPFSQLLDLYGASERIVKEVRQQELKQRVDELTSMGEFIRKWKVLEEILSSKYNSLNLKPPSQWVPVSRMLMVLDNEGLVPGELVSILSELSNFRNTLVHQQNSFSADEISKQVSRLDAVLDRMW